MRCGILAGALLLAISCECLLAAEPPGSHAAFQNRTLNNIRDRYVGHGRHGGRGYGIRRGYGGNIGLSLGIGYPGIGYGFGYPYPGYCLPGYSFSYGYASPYGVYYNSAANYAEYYLPPYYEPAELNYGPKAMERFLLQHQEGQRAAAEAGRAQAAAAQLDALENLIKPAVERPPHRQSNELTRERAARFIEIGDALFAEQRFHEALQRYKTAAEQAPDLAEPFFRQGHALVATHRYDLAVDAFRRAIALEGNILRAGFQLDQLYADNQLSKNAHLEDLARAALEEPQDGDLLFLVGVFLYYDGQDDRAARFFERAAELSQPFIGNHLKPFLPGPPVVPGAEPPRDFDI